MKFVIEKGILLDNIVNVHNAISTKNIIPILSGIKFELNEDGLYLTASDSELAIKSFISKKDIKNVEIEGTIVIQSKYIIDIIRKMPEDLINFELVDGLKLKIYSSNNEYNLNCLDPKEYPSIKFEAHKNPIIIHSGIFKTVINQTAFAISKQELRPLLTGINFKINGNILECVATDSYRLAKKMINLDDAVKNDYNIVIPGSNLLLLDKIISESEENLELHIFNNKVLFIYKNLYFQSNLLSGTYPNTSNLIPTEFDIVINCNLRDFTDAVDRAALLTQSKDKNIIKMQLVKDSLMIRSYASEIGKVEEKLSIETDSKSNLEISYSAKYMLEALKTIKDERISILLNSDVKPIVIKSINDETLIQLILPIKTY